MAAETVRGTPPSSGSQWSTVVHYELLRHMRRRRLLIMVILVAAVVALSLGLPPALGFGISTEPYAVARTVLGGTANLVVVLAATFFGADALLGEFEARTGYLLFPNPVGRPTLFFGKYAAALALTALVLGGLYGVALAAVQIRAGTIPVEIFYSLGMALVYAASALAVAFTISAFFRNQTAASVLIFFLFFLIFALVNAGLSAGHIRPTGSLGFAGETVGNLLQGPYPAAYPKDSEITGRDFTITTYVAPVDTSIVVMAVYVVVALGLALVRFRRRELKG